MTLILSKSILSNDHLFYEGQPQLGRAAISKEANRKPQKLSPCVWWCNSYTLTKQNCIFLSETVTVYLGSRPPLFYQTTQNNYVQITLILSKLILSILHYAFIML